MLNAYWETLEFELPLPGVGERWHRVINTALALSEAVCEIGFSQPYDKETYRVETRSCVVLIAQAV